MSEQGKKPNEVRMRGFDNPQPKEQTEAPQAPPASPNKSTEVKMRGFEGNSPAQPSQQPTPKQPDPASAAKSEPQAAKTADAQRPQPPTGAARGHLTPEQREGMKQEMRERSGRDLDKSRDKSSGKPPEIVDDKQQKNK